MSNKQSNFQLEGLPNILEMKFKANQSYENKENEKMELTLDISSKSEVNQSNKKIKIQLILTLNKDIENSPFLLTCLINGVFNFKTLANEEEMNIFTKSIAPSILLSYTRPIISQFLTYSGFPPYIIPLLDLR